jgi:hypothetical protein
MASVSSSNTNGASSSSSNGVPSSINTSSLGNGSSNSNSSSSSSSGRAPTQTVNRIPRRIAPTTPTGSTSVSLGVSVASQSSIPSTTIRPPGKSTASSSIPSLPPAAASDDNEDDDDRALGGEELQAGRDPRLVPLSLTCLIWLLDGCNVWM